MNLKGFITIVLVVICTQMVSAQGTCTLLGQNPSTAFPVCGTTVFSQTTVPNCGGRRVPVPCSDGAQYSDVGPFWYKFTCFKTGTLGLQVVPVQSSDDYDWQIFDITGKDPNLVYTDASLFVACNWSSNSGTTGTSLAQNSLINCAGPSYPNHSKMPTIVEGHEYILLLSNFSASQQGYRLSFGGGTASITDPKIPALQNISAGCGGTKIGLKLNKKMKCASLAIDASDFSIAPANGSIVSIRGVGCSSGFDTDSIEITMSGILPPGDYNLVMNTGSDGNTLLDNCDREIPAGQSLPFKVFPIAPTPMDSITAVKCAPDMLQLVFQRPINCASISADGSEFTVTGPSTVAITNSIVNCVNGGTRVIQVKLSAPIQQGGTYQIRLKNGNDGNTFLDDCNLETPAGSSLSFIVKDTVSADFNHQVYLGCNIDTISLSHDGRNGVTSWSWYSNNTLISNQQAHEAYYTEFGLKNIKLTVSNGVCSDSTTVPVNLNNTLKANFAGPDVVCPEDLATFKDESIGDITSWNWTFGNGFTSIDENPTAQKYNPPTTTREMFYTAQLVIMNNDNCIDTAILRIKAVNTCKIAVPNAFTPNNDGRNDFLYPLNAYKADNLVFRVFNRFGQLVYETKDWTKKWDGTVNGKAQPTGTFVWILQYFDRDTKQSIIKKGTTVIIR